MAELVMPKLGLTMTEGTLSEWLVAPGDRFSAGQVLYTVETEKVANEVEAEVDGILSEILVRPGETVSVGKPIARITETAEASGESALKVMPAIGVPEGEAAPSSVQDPPSARKLLAEHRLDRSDVVASGRDGRVMKEDVLRVIATPLARRLAHEKGLDLRAVCGSGPRGRIKSADVVATSMQIDAAPARNAALRTPAGLRRIVPDAVRLAIARRVVVAKRDIPHFYLTSEAEIGALTELRRELNAGNDRTRISITHMLIKAVGIALAEIPEMNRIWANEEIIAFDRVDVGMVVESPDGLRIPVLRDVGRANLDTIAKAATDLAERARSGALAPADIGDSVMSVSNVGMLGVTTLTPIINPPNAMILGVGANRMLFRPSPGGQPELRQELSLSLACDHRIVDGADAARFLSHLIRVIESPIRLLRPSHRR